MANALQVHSGMGRLDFESETFVASTVLSHGKGANPLDETLVPEPVSFKASHFTRGKDGAPAGVAPPLSADADKGDQDPLLLARAFNIYPSGGQGADLEASPTEIANSVSAVQNAEATDRGTRIVVPFDSTQITHPENRSKPHPGDPSHSLPKHGHPPAIAEASQRGWRVRRLTPTEAEKLQGFPDGWTLIPYRGKPAKDAPRYRALGNSFAVNVMRWVGRRIQMVEEIMEIQR